MGARRNRFQPSTGISKTLRTASRTMPKMLCPKYWRDSESINGMGNFPQVLAVPGPTVKVFSPSILAVTTNDPDEPRIRACEVAVSGMRG